MDINNPKIVKIRYSIKDKVPIAQINLDLVKSGINLNPSCEAEHETFTNGIIHDSTASTYYELNTPLKQINSDGFGYWTYTPDSNPTNRTCEFIIIFEYKAGKISLCERYKAIAQSVYYYWNGLKKHKDEDKVKFLVIISGDTIYIFNLYDEDTFKYVKELYNFFDLQENSGIKFTGSTAYDKLTMSRYMVEMIQPSAIFEYSGEGIADSLLYMRNNFELNRK